MKKVIKIFLASSITDFAAERNELEVFIRNMSDVYEEQYDIKIKPVRCEQIDPYVTDSRTQDLINASLAECEMCFVLVYTRFGVFSHEEFCYALQKFRESAEHLPKIYVYFKELGEGESADASVKDFMAELNDSLKHYYGTFRNIDTVKLRIALNFVAQKQDIASVALEDGRLALNGVQMSGISLDNVSEFFNSRDLQEQRASLARVEAEYYPLHAALKKGELAEGTEAFEQYSRLAAKRAKLKAEIEQIENDIFNLSVRRSRDEVDGFISERHKAAYALFEQGDLEGASEVLDEEEIESDYRARKARILARKMEELRQNATVYIREIKTKIDILLMLGGHGGWGGNYARALALYERIVPEALENQTCLDVVYEYARLITDHWERAFGGGREEELEKALDAEMELLSLYDESALTTLEQRGLLFALIGRTYYCKDGFASKYLGEARSYLRQAEEILSPLAVRAPEKYNEVIRGVFNVLGSIYERNNDYIAAEQYYVKPTRLYLSSGRRLNDRLKRALVENYLSMNTEITLKQAVELCEEMYATDPTCAELLAACYRAEAHALFAKKQCAIIDYPAPPNPTLEQAIARLLQAIELQKSIAAEQALKHYGVIADDYRALASFYERKNGPFSGDPERERALLSEVEYLEKRFALLKNDDRERFDVCRRIFTIYKIFVDGESFAVSEPYYADGPVDDPDRRAYYNEFWKKWAKELRGLEGNPDLVTGIDDHEPAPTRAQAEEIKRARADEERAKKQAKIDAANSSVWGEGFVAPTQEGVEEQIIYCMERVNDSSEYFDCFAGLIDSHRDELSPTFTIDCAQKLLDELKHYRTVCAAFAVDLAEHSVARDSALVSKLNRIYNNAREHFKVGESPRVEQCKPRQFIAFLEGLAPDETIENKLLSLYDEVVDLAFTWNPPDSASLVKDCTQKSIAILARRDGIESARALVSNLQTLAQVKRIEGDVQGAKEDLDRAEAVLTPYLDTGDVQSAQCGLANVHLSRCSLYKKIERSEQAALEADRAFSLRRAAFHDGYQNSGNAERFKKSYETYRDVLLLLPKDRLLQHLRDYVDYSEFWLARRDDDLYTRELVKAYDMAISLLEGAACFEGAIGIAERKLEKMRALLERYGRKYIDDVRAALSSLVALNLAAGHDNKASEWQQELSLITA